MRIESDLRNPSWSVEDVYMSVRRENREVYAVAEIEFLHCSCLGCILGIPVVVAVELMALSSLIPSRNDLLSSPRSCAKKSTVTNLGVKRLCKRLWVGLEETKCYVRGGIIWCKAIPDSIDPKNESSINAKKVFGQGIRWMRSWTPTFYRFRGRSGPISTMSIGFNLGEIEKGSSLKSSTAI